MAPVSSSGDAPSGSKGAEARSKQRVDVRFAAVYRGRRIDGHGMVRNISESGALIQEAEPPLMAGGRITLDFSFFEDSLPVRVSATVVRETEAGFGVRFVGLDARMRSLLSMAIRKMRARLEATECNPLDDEDDDVTLLQVPGSE